MGTLTLIGTAGSAAPDGLPGAASGGVGSARESLETSIADGVVFSLFTRRSTNAFRINVSDADLGTFFDHTLPTKVLIHGHNDDAAPGSAPDVMKTAFLSTLDCNVILVDYSSEDSANYFEDVAYIVRPVADAVAAVIRMCLLRGSDPDSIHVLGASMGAHIGALATSQMLAPRGWLTGLDVASPLYVNMPEQLRFNEDSAGFTEAYHTSIVMGMTDAVADLDVFVNCGLQPGCGLDVPLGLCSHCYANELYTYLIYNPTLMSATKCSSKWFYKLGLCGKNRKLVVGPQVDKNSRGSYFTDTAAPVAGTYVPACARM